MSIKEFTTADFRTRNLLLWIIGTGLLFPLFFQLSGRIYNSVEPVWDSGGVISQLALPVSLLTCYGGLLLLVANYRRAALSLKVIAAMALIMGLSLVLADSEVNPRKILMFIQVLLPSAGLVLGQLIEDENKIIPRAFLWTLMSIVSVQLLAGWAQGNISLTNYLYVFSIYQHYQYVPLIFICGFVYSMSLLWDTCRKVFYFLIPLMYIYAIESFSMLTTFAFISFIGIFSFIRLKGFKKIQSILLIAVAIAGMQAYFIGMDVIMSNVVINNEDHEGSRIFVFSRYQYTGKYQRLMKGEAPRNVTDRLGDWTLYGNGIIESARTVFLGHPAPFPREVKTSAHNWYLDVAYNFGIISLLPVLFLSVYTLYLLWQRREILSENMYWLAAIVFFLVIVDNNFKVTLRQPYAGTFAYFMWGMLLSGLERCRSKREILYRSY